MTNPLKTLQNALNGFMGYGGTRFPHVDQRPFVLSCKNSRALTGRFTSMVIARPADGFRVLGLGLTCRFGCACLITCTLCIPRYQMIDWLTAPKTAPALALGGSLC